MKISAGISRIGGPLCLYDENGDAIARMADRPGKEQLALDIVKAVNEEHERHAIITEGDAHG